MADMVKPEPDDRTAASPSVKLEGDPGPAGPFLSNLAIHFPDIEHTSSFAWERESEMKISERVATKQKALDDAFHCAEGIVNLITTTCDGEGPDVGHVQKDSEIQAWKEEIYRLKEQHMSLEILVGVAGATGAGKSTILNMLLGRPHLLPSSNSEASTASACQVKYNHDDSPNHLFRAEIDCHTYQEVLCELKKLYEAFGQTFDEETLSSQMERMEQQVNNEVFIREEMKKIKAVWHLEREQVENMTPETLLDSNAHIRELLGSTQSISSADIKEFAELVKPYVDSSPTPQGFEVWPLVKQAKLYVKSPVLKEGITLVDLPGLSDAVETRARVAQRFFDRLDTTIIVTRSSRAIDEKTGVDLMNEYQALQMQANGTFRKKQFCVVASQMDDIDVEGFRLGSQVAKANVNLQSDIEEIDRITLEKGDTEKQLRTQKKNAEVCQTRLEKATRLLRTLEAKKNIGKTPKAEKLHLEKLEKARKKVSSLQAQLANHQTIVDQHHRKLHQLDESLEACEGRAKWTCIRMRHEYIAEKIKKNMKSKLYSSQDQGQDTNAENDGIVEVFSVSAKAYRSHLGGRPPENFPGTSYTGIPQLLAWLRVSALEKREAHLDVLLKALQRLLNGIQQWSNVISWSQTVSFSRRTVEGILSNVHENHKKNLDTELRRWADIIVAIDPFESIKQELMVSNEAVGTVVLKWAFKYPEDARKLEYMAHSTYNAILRRNGGPFLSRGGERRSYNFPESLAVPFLRVMSGNWQTVLHKYIPSHEPLIMKPITEMWHRYVNELVNQIRTAAPAILPQLQECLPVLRRILDEIQLRVREILNGLSRSSSDIQPEFRDALQTRLVPLFAQALEITGTGSYKKRREYLQQHVVERVQPMFDYAYKRMEEAYGIYRKNVLYDFVYVSTFAFDKAKQHFDLLLANLKKTKKSNTRNDSPRHKEEVDDSIALKHNVARLAQEWENMWRFPGQVEHISDSLELPLRFVKRSHDLEDMEEDSDEEDEDEDSDDGDIDMDEDEEEDEE
ncbi:uncharacterized protein B0T23DRAFT_429139 [Neurospora hispaniola]|uniref:Dynamin N-terminal domain-containing protein n=1 Tax=Neurospora hispaniola TaxID=588809 RepID=A0AAJ0MRR4_9PEZI|nr:hypothetical protein B0T23DRAFT_429139 [Neurospora hispaniola]